MKIAFEHKQSAHCENGVASNLMRFNGYEVSEPMVFGIGSGLLFCYIPFVKLDSAPLITYRAMAGFIFKRFAKRVGIVIKREKFKDPKKAQERLDENLRKNNPVGLQVGVYHLVYFPDEYRFHFNAHNLVVYGKEDDTYLISDPTMEKVTTLTAQQLEKVRYAKGAFAPKGHMYYPISFPEKLNLEHAIKKGIKHTCREMLAPVPIVGYKGIKTVAKLIRKWPIKKGTKRANHYLGQIVRMQEEIGTGGGGFRYIYAAFLQEASDVLQNDTLSELSKEMTEIGDLWRDFALEASRIYRNRSAQTDAYNKVADQLDSIGNRERDFFRKLKKAI
ncbi:DUF4872 domain-containing protein [Aggregatimonas sangjinii]|uniref:DUF4872 domain-containing protein n=1 Tax=Aggregatimonas sangjinii TaxID=2583587 RepID=A0A5B7STE3_9FLAO|nr:BtrH N-terminal domain-containing protein [Aggregatimonas sangjinii]QCX01472.1 DUF4872 domain-containing protein [Aggregatimonas sangjinii]